MIAVAPVTLTGKPQTIQLTAAMQSGTRFPVRVANESTYALQVGVGVGSRWLDPGMVDVFDPGTTITKVTVNPSVLTGQPRGTVLVTLAEEGETFPGSYPMSLPQQSIPPAFGLPYGFGETQLGSTGSWVNVTGTGLDNLATASNKIHFLQWSVAISGAAGVQNSTRIGLQGSSTNDVFELDRVMTEGNSAQSGHITLDWRDNPLVPSNLFDATVDTNFGLVCFGIDVAMPSGVIWIESS